MKAGYIIFNVCACLACALYALYAYTVNNAGAAFMMAVAAVFFGFTALARAFKV